MQLLLAVRSVGSQKPISVLCVVHVCSMRELNVELCRGNILMYCTCLGMLAKSSGMGFQAGMCVPTDEYDEETIPCNGL
jgi:hypothetical protein